MVIVACAVFSGRFVSVQHTLRPMAQSSVRVYGKDMLVRHVILMCVINTPWFVVLSTVDAFINRLTKLSLSEALEMYIVFTCITDCQQRLTTGDNLVCFTDFEHSTATPCTCY